MSDFDIIEFLLLLLALMVAVPILTLVAQIYLARDIKLLFKRKPSCARLRIAVLVPAHNEGPVIGATLANLLVQLNADDRLLVVADNCTDDTAELVRQAGAEVVERFHEFDRGKGFALDFGVRHLASNPPEVLVIVDADCQMAEGSLDAMASLVQETGRPVQSLDLMQTPLGGSLKTRIAEWAWRVKNQVRPLGWHRMGWPCQLMGTGMAFPWAMAERMALANGHLVEDMKLGVDLALAGTPPLFCPQALVSSDFPTESAAQHSQRKRWEHGHLSLLLGLGPRLLWQGVKRRSMPTVAMALDVLVPPVALLGLLLALLWCAALLLVAYAGIAHASPLVLATLLVLLFKLALWRAWWGWGRDLVSAREWLQVPFFLLAKVPLYFGFIFRRQKAWVRTDRQGKP